MPKNQFSTSHPQFSELEEAWVKAKNAEAGWKKYRQEVETQLLAIIGPEVEFARKQLAKSDKLSTSYALGTLTVKLERSVSAEQADLQQFVLTHGEAASALVRVQYGLISNSMAYKVSKGEGSVSGPLAELLTLTDKPPVFSHTPPKK